MFTQLFSHTLLIIVFFLGSTFSCMALANISIKVGHADVIHEEDTTDICCTESGHQKHIESKKEIQFIQQQFDNLEDTPTTTRKLYEDKEYISNQSDITYQDPSYDRQSQFFVDIIRLLL